jgi:hypothetical protein
MRTLEYYMVVYGNAIRYATCRFVRATSRHEQKEKKQ